MAALLVDTEKTPGFQATSADERVQENTNLSAVVVLTEKAPIAPPQKPAQLKLLFHAQLKGKEEDAEDLADFVTNSMYLHEKKNTFTLSAGPHRAPHNEFIFCKLANYLTAEQCDSKGALIKSQEKAFLSPQDFSLLKKNKKKKQFRVISEIKCNL